MSDQDTAQAVNRYVEARARLEELSDDIDRLASILIEAGTALHDHPARFRLAGMPPFPPASVAGESKVVESPSDAWWTAEQVQEKLGQWHEARAQVKSAWKAVPQRQRRALRPPPADLLEEPDRRPYLHMR